MSFIEKWYTLLIFISIVLGITLGQVELIRNIAEHVLLPLLVIMLYITFIQIPTKEIKKAFLHHKFTMAAVVTNFIWTPFLAWILALIFLVDQPALFIGFILLMVTPCTDWYLIFTGIAKGNVALSIAILPLSLFLQVILLPAYLYIFASSTGIIDFSFLLNRIFIVLIIPLLLAYLTKKILKNKQELSNRLLPKISTLPILLLCLVITFMFAFQGHLLLAHIGLLWQIIVPILLFFIINLFISQKTGQLLRLSDRDRTSLGLTTLARNSPIALAIAMTAFPDQPFIALTLVIGPLLELPILSIIAQYLLLRTKRIRITS